MPKLDQRKLSRLSEKELIKKKKEMSLKLVAYTFDGLVTVHLSMTDQLPHPEDPARCQAHKD